ncbi:hypothetical protein K504DRAFT_460540 [Pleomassaria siparia CBS 279.74]|uniref:Uncharacterized protein n=1 Tax=Pleomassaria siparia CBS 279.74 TaxID=1314801 RepID=A0A6G1JXE8_9PLEO|nr:hypothetical protein K504DRAFT_460540 [Pleomassaria siparia CBS 279.74]
MNDAPCRNFFGLTQVNRQIRSEFRHIYTRETCILLDDCDVKDYLDTFYAYGATNKDVYQGHGRIAVGIYPLRYKSPTIAIEHIIQLATKAIDLSFSFTGYKRLGMCAALNNIFFSRLEVWKAAIDTGIHIRVSHHSKDCIFFFLVGTNDRWFEAGCEIEVAAFLATLGLHKHWGRWIHVYQWDAPLEVVVAVSVRLRLVPGETGPLDPSMIVDYFHEDDLRSTA